MPRRVRLSAVAALVVGLVACTSGDPGAGRSTRTQSAPASSESASPSPPRGTAPDEDDAVANAISALDRREQVAQLFVVGVPLADLGSGDALVREAGVGGVFLRGRSAAPAEEIAATTARWRRSPRDRGRGWPSTRRAARCRRCPGRVSRPSRRRSSRAG